MKRIQYHRYGGPDVLRYEEFEPGRPGQGQILVRVKAASANPVDYKVRNGMLKLMTGFRFPRAMGSDYAGIVEAVGSAVTRLKVGAEVFGTAALKAGGAFAERIVADEARAVAKPASLSFVQAAALPVIGATAWCGLVQKAHLKSGQSVFIHGCLGGVGRIAVQLAKMLGAQVAGSCRGTELTAARALGVDPVVDFQRFTVDSLKGRFDVVFDTAGSLTLSDGRALIKRGGMVLDINPTLPKIVGSVFTTGHRFLMANPSAAVLASIAEAAAAGKLVVPVGRTVPLSEAIAALTEWEQTGVPKGKLIIVPTDA